MGKKIMTLTTKRSLVAINVFVIFMMLGLFGVGYFAVHVSDKALSSKTVDYDTKLRGRIGKPYTSEQHNYAVDFLNSGDEQNESMVKALHSLSNVAFEIGGFSAVLLLLNTFLIIRNCNTKLAQQDVAPDG